MAAFEYEALDALGRTRKGVVSAETPRLARRELRQNRLVPVRVSPAATPREGVMSRLPRLFVPRIGTSEVMLVTRQLATMISAAAPVEEALRAVALQTENKAFQTILFAVRTSVTEGAKLSEALARHPGVFSALYISLVGAGEMSGALGAILERLADHLERTGRMRAKVTIALVYPSVLAAVAGFVVLVLLMFVVPKVVEQFDSLGQDLPLLTKALIAVSGALSDYGIFALAALIAAGVFAQRALRTPDVRRRFDRAILRLPVLGRVVRQHQVARLARTLGTLFAAGVPALDALTAARATLSNTVLADGVSSVIAAVREGSGLSAALRQSKVFPPVVATMVAGGENSGRFDAMLDKAADQLEREFETVTAVAVGLLEPGIIVVMGGVVALIVMAILMPIFQLNTLALM
jgi:general secretion pathway protein F